MKYLKLTTILIACFLLQGCLVCEPSLNLPLTELKKIPDGATSVYLIPKSDSLIASIFEQLALNTADGGYIIEHELTNRNTLYTTNKSIFITPLIYKGNQILRIGGIDFNSRAANYSKTYQMGSSKCLNDPFLNLISITMNLDTNLVSRIYK
jgi:hypothetical protein